MRRLGLDHGEKRVGVALSDEDGRIAQPHATLARRDADALLAEVAALAKEREVGEIVVGLPLHLDGSEGASARRARRFAERLAEATGLPVVLWDERWTTALAERALGDAGVSARDQRKVVDKVAAALLLQGYLDAKSSSNGSERDEAWVATREPPEPAGEPRRDRGRERRSRGR